MNRPAQWASASGRPVQWASARSRSPQRESSSIVQAQEASRRSWVASSRGKYPVTSFSRPVTSFSSNKTLNGAGSRGQHSSGSLSPHGVSSRSMSPHGVSSRSRPGDRGGSHLTSSSRNKIHNGAGSRGQPSSRSRSPHGVSSRSMSPHGVSSGSRPTDRGRSPLMSSSRNKTHNGAGSRGQPSSRSRSPHGVSSRSMSPHGVSSGSRPTDRGGSPLTSSSRNKTHNGAGSRGQPSSRSRSSHGVSSRSRHANREKCPLTSSSSNKTHNGAGSRGQPTKRSPSPQGAVSRSPSPQGATRRSPSPQGAVSRSPSPQAATNKSGNQISIFVNIDQNSEDEDGVSATSTGADADHTALSSPEPPDGLYGVKVSNFHFQLKSKHIKSCLTEHFMPYGNVVCVTMHGTFKDRYGLVFYKQKWEREKALKADTNGPLEKELCITRWSGPSPCIFGIVVTDINDTSLDVPDRIQSEFSIFGDIALVMMRGLLLERFVVVFYKDRKSQEKALATKNPFKTSFGEVNLHAWNRPPPPQSEMSNDDILMAVGYSDVAVLAAQ